jgi:hypothetical protein
MAFPDTTGAQQPRKPISVALQVGKGEVAGRVIASDPPDCQFLSGFIGVTINRLVGDVETA